MSELQGLQSKQSEFKQRGIQTLSIALASPSDVQLVADKYGIDYPLLADPEGKAVDLYRLRHKGGSMEGTDIARPGMFLIDAQGKIIWRHFAENWRVRADLDDVLAGIPQR